MIRATESDPDDSQSPRTAQCPSHRLHPCYRTGTRSFDHKRASRKIMQGLPRARVKEVQVDNRDSRPLPPAKPCRPEEKHWRSRVTPERIEYRRRRFAKREVVSLRIHYFNSGPALSECLSVAYRTAQNREVRERDGKPDCRGPSARTGEGNRKRQNLRRNRESRPDTISIKNAKERRQKARDITDGKFFRFRGRQTAKDRTVVHKASGPGGFRGF